jgi:prepilin-type N-terminal cleavage/methylation domain-containing protein
MKLPATTAEPKPTLGFTLIEVVVSIAVAGLIFAAIIVAYIQAANFAEWSGYSLAAHSLCVQQLEQAKGAKWDTQVVPPLDELTNCVHLASWSFANGTWSGYTNYVLDIPISGTNVVRATNYVWLTDMAISANPPVVIKMLRVQTVWSFRGRAQTNTIATYLAPDA